MAWVGVLFIVLLYHSITSTDYSGLHVCSLTSATVATVVFSPSEYSVTEGEGPVEVVMTLTPETTLAPDLSIQILVDAVLFGQLLPLAISDGVYSISSVINPMRCRVMVLVWSVCLSVYLCA